MRGSGQAQPVIHGVAYAGERAGAGGNSSSFHNVSKECIRRVRFEDRGRSFRAAATLKQHPLLDKVADGTRPARPPDGILMKDKQTGELLPFGENIAQQKLEKDLGIVDEDQEIRLRGKLKWLFEQDRMFWESNSAKSSRRGSPECDRSRSLNSLSATAKPAPVDSSNDAKLVGGVEESFKRVCRSSRKPPVDKLKLPRQLHQQRQQDHEQEQTTDKAVGLRGEGSLSTDRHPSPAKVPWTFSTSTAKFWPRGKSKGQNSTNAPNAAYAESEGRALPAVAGRQSTVSYMKRTKANSEDATLSLSSLEEIFTYYDDAPKSNESSDIMTSSDEDEEERNKGNAVIASEGGERSNLEEVKDQAAYLKLKCDMLAKEKDHALRKWKRSSQEIDDAAKMAQALRTAIETLLEAGASDSKSDIKARKAILEDQTLALKLRMESLRRKNSEGILAQPKVTKTPKPSPEDRLDTMKESSEGRPSLPRTDVPRDTEYKVEALRARLERLMLATNSRIPDERRQPQRSVREEKKKPVQDWCPHKSCRDETSELKMKGWLDSLSAELTSDASPTASAGVCEKCNGAGAFVCSREMHHSGTTPSGSTSKHNTPSTSKQESPGSAASSEETKKNVIHKIAEEVRMEAEQWFQVQELLGRVGEDMESLQEACSSWERRAIHAEARVLEMQQECRPDKAETPGRHLGDEKVDELKKEMSRLRETVDEVKTQVGSIKIDPSGWFEAAQKYGYAFMPANLLQSSNKHKSSSSCGDATPPDWSHQRRRLSSGPAAAAGLSHQPSVPANDSTGLSGATTSSEKAHAANEVRQRFQLPSLQWAKEVARAEEDEILVAANASGLVSKLEFPNPGTTEVSCASDGKLLGGKDTSKLLEDELALALVSSDSKGEVALQLQQASIRERYSGLLQQEDQQARYVSLAASSRRSPLRDVLENITSSKENKRPNQIG